MGGGFLRLLLLLFIIWLAFRIGRHFWQQHISQRQTRPKRIPRMLPCARCGVHVPEDKAFRLGDKLYCDEHRPVSRD